MAFQNYSAPGSGDFQNRRSILQGLQQTRSRLQRMHSDEPLRPSPVHSLQRGPAPSHHPQAHSLAADVSTNSKPLQTNSPASLSAPRPMHTSPSPNEYSYIVQQQKMVMQQANSQSFAYFITQPSTHGNLLLPVIPRFDSNGQITNIM